MVVGATDSLQYLRTSEIVISPAVRLSQLYTVNQNIVDQKKTHNRKAENYVLFWRRNEDLSPGGSLSAEIALRECSKEVREEPAYVKFFATKMR